jgi:hypothetical protein
MTTAPQGNDASRRRPDLGGMRMLLPLAVCAGTFTLLMGASASHRTGHPLPSLCRLGQAVDAYDPTLEPMLHTLGTAPAGRSCDATVPDDHTPAPAPGPEPRAGLPPGKEDVPGARS